MEDFIKGFLGLALMVAWFGLLVFAAGFCYQLYMVLLKDRTLKLKALGLIVLTRLLTIFCATVLTLFFWKFNMGWGIIVALLLSEFTLSRMLLKVFGYNTWSRSKEQEAADEQALTSERYKETIATWNTLSQTYQDRFMDLTLYDHTYDAFCEQLAKKPARVLEIGCGPGNITRYLLLKCPDLRMFATDAAPAMIRLAKENIPRDLKKHVDFEVMDSRRISSLKATFDAIVSGFCIPYLSAPDCSGLIKDCGSLLSENGILYLSFVPGNHSQSGFMGGGANSGRTYFYYHDLEFIERELSKNYFETVYLERIVFERSTGEKELHLVLIARKRAHEARLSDQQTVTG